MRSLLEFLRNTMGGVRTGGPVIYVLILGLFLSIVAAMGPSDGARRVGGPGGATIELDIRNWVEGLFGGALPQVGPLQR